MRPAILLLILIPPFPVLIKRIFINYKCLHSLVLSDQTRREFAYVKILNVIPLSRKKREIHSIYNQRYHWACPAEYFFDEHASAIRSPLGECIRRTVDARFSRAA